MNKLGIKEQIIAIKAPVCPCQKRCVVTAEETNVSFGSPCPECMHLDAKNLMECKCACFQQNSELPDCQHIQVFDSGNEQCRCVHLDEGSSEPEQADTPEHQCIHLQTQEQPEEQTQCQCHCHCQTQNPEEYLCTEKSSSPESQPCTCMQKVSPEGLYSFSLSHIYKYSNMYILIMVRIKCYKCVQTTKSLQCSI